MILFEMPGCKGIPAEAALAGRYELLVGAPDDVFTEPVHSICLQIEVFNPDAILKSNLIPFLRIVAGLR